MFNGVAVGTFPPIIRVELAADAATSPDLPRPAFQPVIKGEELLAIETAGEEAAGIVLSGVGGLPVAVGLSGVGGVGLTHLAGSHRTKFIVNLEPARVPVVVMAHWFPALLVHIEFVRKMQVRRINHPPIR